VEENKNENTMVEIFVSAANKATEEKNNV